jgi:hypothetical protein
MITLIVENKLRVVVTILLTKMRVLKLMLLIDKCINSKELKW